MRRLWLHIGSHKTGTSSLQRNLRRAKNQGQLGDLAYLHPQGHYQANPIVEIEGEGAEMLPVLRHDLIEELITRNKKDAVLSTEMLFWLDDPALVQALADQLRKRFGDIRIVAYLRRQDALALSHRKQVVMGTAAVQFYGCQISALPRYEPHMHRYFDYDRKLAMWESVFGRDALILRRFEPAALVGADTVTDFFHLIGVELVERVEDVNQALSRSALLAGLWLRQRGYPRRTFETLLEELADDGKLMPARSEAQAFLDHFTNSNRALAARYDPQGPECYFSDDFSRYPETGNDRLENLTVDLEALDATVRKNLEMMDHDAS